MTARTNDRGAPGLPHLAWATLGSGAIWATHLIAGYNYVAIACHTGTEWVLHLLTVAALIGVVLSGLSSWRIRSRSRALEREQGSLAGQRSAELALYGLAFSVLFGLAIILSEVAILVVGPCE